MPPSKKTRVNRAETILHLQQAFKLAFSLVVFYSIALWTNWDDPQYGALAIVIISLGTRGASIQQGVLRVVGTTAGVAVGFLILGLFSHDRWSTMVAFSVYLTGIGYFMQASRFPYAWYVAAFVPLVVWGDNYPQFESAFYFGTFRWLETTVGVLIYTVVDLVLWPRRASDQLDMQGQDLWIKLRKLLANYRQQLEKGELPDDVSDRRIELAETLSQAISSLNDSFFDSPDVSSQKKAWEAWRWNASRLVDALELWRECIDDCRELDLDRLLPQLSLALNTLDKRLERINILWISRGSATDVPSADDRLLMETLALKLEPAASAKLSHFDRAALNGFLGQLQILDQTSRELLQTMGVLAGLESIRSFRPSTHVQKMNQSSRWDPERLIHALFPPIAFIVAFCFWVLIYPPPGPKVPMFAGILSLILLRAPANPMALLTVFLLAIVFIVAPVYWLVMPQLSTGFELIGLIFLYTFVFGFLGARSPALKSGPLIMFVVMTGISNHQHYSFAGLVDGALMILLSGTIVTIVYYCFSPIRPEQALLRSLRKFFHGCARVTGGFAWDRSSERSREQRLRKRFFKSMVLPAPAKIHKIQSTLDYRRYPDNSPDKVQQLHDSVQSIVFRLESLEIAHNRIAGKSPGFPESLDSLESQIKEIVRQVFEDWATLKPGDAFGQQHHVLQQLSRDLQQQLELLATHRERDSAGDELLTNLYTLLGCVQGLIAAMAHTQNTVNQINWAQWSEVRL